jgi:hypothetical protein
MARERAVDRIAAEQDSTPASIPGYQPVFHNQAATAAMGPPGGRRGEIIAYIKQALGEYLAAEYDEAIHSSVSTGCYDTDWATLGGVNVKRYIKILEQDWISKQGDVMQAAYKVLLLRKFGTDQQKELLEQLGLLHE